MRPTLFFTVFRGVFLLLKYDPNPQTILCSCTSGIQAVLWGNIYTPCFQTACFVTFHDLGCGYVSQFFVFFFFQRESTHIPAVKYQPSIPTCDETNVFVNITWLHLLGNLQLYDSLYKKKILHNQNVPKVKATAYTLGKFSLEAHNKIFRRLASVHYESHPSAKVFIRNSQSS